MCTCKLKSQMANHIYKKSFVKKCTMYMINLQMNYVRSYISWYDNFHFVKMFTNTFSCWKSSQKYSN